MQGRQSSSLMVAALVALAAAEKRADTTVDVGGSQLASCPGVVNVDESSTVCCVGGSLSLAPLDLSSCAGWPICTRPVTITPSSTPDQPPQTCATVLNMNDPSYSSMLAAATASIAASGTNAATTIHPTGPAASPGSSLSGSSGATASSASGRSSSATSAAASSASSAAANIAVTPGVPGTMIGGVAAAWGFGLVAFLL